MSIALEAKEEQLRSEIAQRVDIARKEFAESRHGDGVQKAIFEGGQRAHQLHMLLKARGVEPKHHRSMIKNRDLEPADPDFYMHFHPLEDLLKFIDDPHANDDPPDRTIGENFDFRVFSRRWGHDDVYRITRTEEGWDIRHIMIGGPSDKRGHPALFQNLDHDSIAYPSGLDLRMEWLWNQAQEQGLSKEAIQEALQQMADWVSATEQSSPGGRIWEGF